MNRGQNKMLKKLIFLLVTTFCLISINYANEKSNLESGIIYGTNYSFLISAQGDWILDNESGRPNGVNVVFYPKGSNWKKSDVVMYINTTTKNEKQNDISNYIKLEIKNLKEKHRKIQITKSNEIYTMDKKKVTIYYVSGDNYGNYEAIGYLDEKNVIVVFVLSSRTKNGFIENIAKFEELIKSYKWLTEKININFNKK